MKLQTTYSNRSEFGQTTDSYDAVYSQCYLDTPPSLSYLALSPQPSDSYDDQQDKTSEICGSPLEAITDNVTRIKTNDPLEDFLTGKTAFLAKTAEELLGLVYEREQLKYDNIRNIEYESSQLKSRLFEIEDWRTGCDKGIDKTRGQIEGNLLAFEREKRMEEINCWRDIVRLKGELREALREFQQGKSRESLLSL